MKKVAFPVSMRIMSVWETLEPFKAFGTVWKPLEQFGNLMYSLGTFGTAWKPLEQFRNLWNSSEPLEQFENL